MTDLIQHLALGFSVSLSISNLLYCLIGAIVGTIIGVLPGLGPAATISLLLPITFHLDATASIIMLSGIYYGAMYGGSISAILIRVPGEAASIVTVLDGYEMAKQGRAGAALGISAFGSYIAGILATLALAWLGSELAHWAVEFGPVEKASLVILGLVLVAFIVEGSRAKALTMVGFGLLIATVGLDPMSGDRRFTFGSTYLMDGLSVVILSMGLFGIAELLEIAQGGESRGDLTATPKRIRELLPNRKDWAESIGPILRGSGLGFVLGILPGGGVLMSSFASYVMEKKLAKDPTRFGKGAIAGVAGPEAANNAAAQGGFVPLLALGIPPNVVMGVMMGALMIQGVAPGPMLAQTRPDLFWGVITSMFIGNTMLIILNVPLVGVFVQLLKVPYRLLAPLIMLVCVVGAYSLNNNPSDVIVMMIADIAGWLMRKVKLDPAPLLIAVVLGDQLEASVRQSLLIGYGSPHVFLESPVAVIFLVAAFGIVVWPLARKLLFKFVARSSHD